MRFCFYTISISPYQLPLAQELVARLGRDNYRYVHAAAMSEDRRKLGWTEVSCEWIVSEEENRETARQLLEECDVLLSGLRDLDLFEKRGRAWERTIYSGERWFEPPFGMLRLLHTSSFRMAFRFVRLYREWRARGTTDQGKLGLFSREEQASQFAAVFERAVREFSDARTRPNRSGA